MILRCLQWLTLIDPARDHLCTLIGADAETKQTSTGTATKEAKEHVMVVESEKNEYVTCFRSVSGEATGQVSKVTNVTTSHGDAVRPGLRWAAVIGAELAEMTDPQHPS